MAAQADRNHCMQAGWALQHGVLAYMASDTSCVNMAVKGKGVPAGGNRLGTGCRLQLLSGCGLQG